LRSALALTWISESALHEPRLRALFPPLLGLQWLLSCLESTLFCV